MWRVLRIAILLMVLVLVGTNAVLARWDARDWDNPLYVGVIPINADGRPATQAYVDQLNSEQFAAIEAFFASEARSFELAIEQPVAVTLYPEVAQQPPSIEPGTGAFRTMLWSLKLRWYNWRVGDDVGEQVKLYVLFHDPAVVNEVPHSLGLQKGLIGVVHAFAARNMQEQNNIVVAHELLHTLGATDKYDPQTNLPIFPDGYGDPQAQPRFPQAIAEVMAGRRMVGKDEARMPDSLQDVVIGEKTATEINWLQQ